MLLSLGRQEKHTLLLCRILTGNWPKRVKETCANLCGNLVQFSEPFLRDSELCS